MEQQGRFPNRLKMYRRLAGMSQKRVARMLGLSDTTMISRWEHGISTPSIVQAFQLCRIYRALPQELYVELWNTHQSVHATP